MSLPTDRPDVARRFELHQDRAVPGESDVVAEGAEFVQPTIIVFPDGLRQRMPAGWCRLVLLAGRRQTLVCRSVDDVMAIHGHPGATRLVWVD